MAPVAPIEHSDDNTRLAAIIDGLCENQETAAALEAENAVHLAAAMRIVLARMGGDRPAKQTREMQLRSVAAEIGLALRWSDRTVQRHMGEALELVENFPATLEALSSGRITARHAAVVREAGWVITEAEERAAFEKVVLERAERETAARTKAFAIALAERMNPESITVRHEEARKQRAVTVAEVDNGMAELRALLPAAEAFGIHDRLTQQARAIRAVAADTAAEAGAEAEAAAGDDGTLPGLAVEEAEAAIIDTRTLDQVRADLFCDLLLTGQPAIDPTHDVLPGGLGAIRASIQVTVPALTLAGKDDRGASIEGKSPIDAATACRLAAGAPGWDRILQHPVTGIVLAVDTYRRTKDMDRFLTARDIHCRFPGCRMPARLCDHDHNLDWALGGKTDVCNLACLCKRHHTLKTETEWVARQLADGSIEWTSPLGRTYVDEVPPRVVFIPDGDPPPF